MEIPRHDVESPELEAPVTVLDLLNADCWRAVLDYLDIDDVVRSERVSRGWQQVVLGYLPGVTSYYYGSKHPTNQNYRKIKLTRVNVGRERGHKLMFKEMLKKLSPYFVRLFLGFTRSWLLTKFTITFNMDKLEDLTLYHIEPRFIDNVELKNCKRLKRVAFESCSLIHDHHLEKLITSNDIEELSINETYNISGEFMINLNSNLKYLTLNKCWDLQFNSSFISYKLLSGLRKLELNSNPLVDIDNVHMLVVNMPKLESLSLNGYRTRKIVAVGTKLITAIGQLSELKHFSMSYITTDALLEALASGCKQLRSLHVEFCPVSGAAVASLCRELPDLSELSVLGCRHVTDDDLSVCIASANLTMLDASYCPVSSELVSAAARDVRRRPRKFLLRLNSSVRNVNLEATDRARTGSEETNDEDQHS